MNPSQPDSHQNLSGSSYPVDPAGSTAPTPAPASPHHEVAAGPYHPMASPTDSAPQAGSGDLEKRRMNPWLAGGIGAVVGVLGTIATLALAGLFGGSTAAVHLIEETVSVCGDPQGITIVDEGKSLLFDSEGDEDFTGASYADMACVFTGLEVPDHVLDQMTRTSALSGNQSATWGDYEAQWSYHPDQGLDGVIRVSNDATNW